MNTRIKIPSGKLLYYLLTLILFGLIVYRSVMMDFTNDEAFSFLNVANNNFRMMYGTANTHWLNSSFMMLWNFILGDSEWKLRIHSCISFLFLSYYLGKIFNTYNRSLLILIPITVVLMNNYLLDYFSLARGYALSLLFETMAIYYIVHSHSKNALKVYLFLSLATFANYTCIYFLYAYLLIDIVETIRKDSYKKLYSREFIRDRFSVFIISIWAIPNILFIKYVTHDLNEGLTNGFLKDTLGKFIERSFTSLPISFVEYLCLLAFLCLLFFYILFYHTMHQGFRKLISILLATFILVELSFFLLHTPYPYGRTAFFFILPFLILFSYLLIFVVHKMGSLFKFVLPLLLFALNGNYILQHRNLLTTIEYWKQQGIKTCMNDLYFLESNKIKKIKVGMSIDHYGSFLNYYKYLNPSHYPDSCFVYDREGFEKISPRDVLQFSKQDYLLMNGDYQAFLNAHLGDKSVHFVKHYDAMKTDLLKLEE